MAAKPKTAPLPALSEIADELGQLKHEYEVLIAPFALKKPRMEVLEKILRERCPVPDDQEWRVQGTRFEVVLSARAKWRSVNLSKLVKAIGQKAVNVLATISLKDVESHPQVTAEILSDVIGTPRPVGPRTLKAFEKGATTI